MGAMLFRNQLLRVSRSGLSRVLIAAVLLCASGQPENGSVPHPPAYLDPHLPIVARVDDLIGRMTLVEKVSQMQNDAVAIPRLGIPAYNWWNEGLHGMARSGYATVFPQAIGLAATWDTALIQKVAGTISTEARAKYNNAIAEGNHSIYYGLTLWSPNINIDRDPRWGRGQETYGEDPFLTGQIGSAFVRGLQGSDDRYLKVVATAKHFAVHSGPESERHQFDARISAHDLNDTYLPAFRELVVNAHVDSVMCAYNALDGSPACANHMLLEDTLRKNWHFDGYVVSDCGAITDIAVGHKAALDPTHAAVQSVKAGTDLSCGPEYESLVDAVRSGLISESEIDIAVKRLFIARFRLGMFDPAPQVPFSRIPFAKNDSPGHAALALETARASVVLLKNDGVLPIRPDTRSIAVIGPNADSLAALEGNYNAVPSHPVTPLEGLRQRYPGRIQYAQGASYADGAPVSVPETLLHVTYQGQSAAGLLGEYFDSTDFSGSAKFRRIDRHINFDWNGAAPAPDISAKSFSVRWTGTITPPAAGTTTFGFTLAHCSSCDDAEKISIWLDGKLVSEYVHAATPGRRSTTPPFKLTFGDTKPHPIRIEYTHDAPLFGAGLSFNWWPAAETLRNEAVSAAAVSDVALAFVGLSPDLEGEDMPVHIEGFSGGDRTRIELPATQQQLLSAVANTGKPVVVILMSGSVVALEHAAEKASAVLEAWYPGEAGGIAIADILAGNYNPSGRLPVTFYASTDQLPAFEDYSMDHRTYRYFSGEPLYSFGFGLSYTKFQYSSGKLSTTSLEAGKPLSVTFTVKNIGDCDGEEVAELYLMPEGLVGVPRKTLVGFKKMFVSRGASKTVQLVIDPRQLSYVLAVGTRAVRPGEYKLFVGGGQPSASHGIQLSFSITGTAMVPR
jgi:beta-glucosidase